MTIKINSKIALTVLGLFITGLSFMACNNGDAPKTETPKVDSPKTEAPKPDSPAIEMKSNPIEDSGKLKGNGKPGNEKPSGG